MTDLVLPASDKIQGSGPAAPAWRAMAPTALFAIIIGATMIGQLWFAFMRQINWDEYYFLARIHEYARGDLQDVLLTFHVHLFYWLTFLPANEVDQIVVARLVMLGLSAGTLAMIFLIARRITCSSTALFAVAAYATSSNVIVHGASFRFDPVATFLLMSALALLTVSRLRWHHAAAVGILIAIAGLITIKSIFYLPIAIAVGLWRLAGSADRRATFLALAGGGVVSGIAFAGLHLLHGASMKGKSSASETEAFLSHSVSTMLNFGELSTKWVFLVQSMLQNVVLWAGILVGIAVLIGQLHRAGYKKSDSWTLLAFAFPLLTQQFPLLLRLRAGPGSHVRGRRRRRPELVDRPNAARELAGLRAGRPAFPQFLQGPVRTTRDGRCRARGVSRTGEIHRPIFDDRQLSEGRLLHEHLGYGDLSFVRGSLLPETAAVAFYPLLPRDITALRDHLPVPSNPAPSKAIFNGF